MQNAEFVYDFFVSYAETDRAWVEGYLLDALTNANLACHTEAAFELGAPRITEFERAIKQSKRTLLILSPAYLLDEGRVFTDVLAQSYGLDTNTWPVIPLFMRPVAEEKLPPRLRMLTSLDATDERNWESVIQRLVKSAGRPVPGPAPKPAPPYPGLRAFREEESRLFYGREGEVEDLVRLLRTHPFLALIGPSGSGKSSLVCAGLIPKLRQSSAFGSGEWLIRSLRPGQTPLEALSNALGGDPSQPEVAVSTLISTQPNAQRLLLFIDQFEELFTVAEGDTRSFQEALARLAESDHAYIILAARADFYATLMTAPLWPEIQRHRYEVLPLNEQALAWAVFKPAEDVGVYIEPTLVERLIADAGEEPGILPFVQETMILLWDRIERHYLPLSAYEALILPRKAYGDRSPDKLTGLQVAIALHADAALDSLDERQKAITRRIFVRLVQFGEGRPDTRRQQPVSLLRATEDPILFDRTLAHLADEKHRLLTLTGDENYSERKVDLAHEALIAAWPTLLGWLDAWREAELARRRMENDARQWAEADRNDFYLYQGTRFEQAQAWTAKYEGETSELLQNFLKTSQRREAMRRRLGQAFLALVGLFALFGLGSVVYVTRQIDLNLSARGEIVSFDAGPAVLGFGSNADEELPRSSPARLVEVPVFSLEKHEVTNGQYRRCVQAGFCIPPLEPAHVESYQTADEDLPVVWVTAYQAARFCYWIGRRLPTEVEWERAARGSEHRSWPWGTDPPTPSHANLIWETASFVEPGLVRVNDPAYLLGNTPEGMTHLLGNVWEWTSTPVDCNDPYNCPAPWDGQSRVESLYTRGLSYRIPLRKRDVESDDPAPLSMYALLDPHRSDADIGFRCADS